MRALAARARRLYREAKLVAWALAHRDHPVLAQLVVIRRCNLACAYCNEYDKTSDPVPRATLETRVDHLAALGTSIVTLHGGEELPLERNGDLSEGNAGMLIFVEGRERPEYVPWIDVEQIDFERVAEVYPPFRSR